LGARVSRLRYRAVRCLFTRYLCYVLPRFHPGGCTLRLRSVTPYHITVWLPFFCVYCTSVRLIYALLRTFHVCSVAADYGCYPVYAPAVTRFLDLVRLPRTTHTVLYGLRCCWIGSLHGYRCLRAVRLPFPYVPVAIGYLPVAAATQLLCASVAVAVLYAVAIRYTALPHGSAVEFCLTGCRLGLLPLRLPRIAARFCCVYVYDFAAITTPAVTRQMRCRTFSAIVAFAILILFYVTLMLYVCCCALRLLFDRCVTSVTLPLCR